MELRFSNSFLPFMILLKDAPMLTANNSDLSSSSLLDRDPYQHTQCTIRYVPVLQFEHKNVHQLKTVLTSTERPIHAIGVTSPRAMEVLMQAQNEVKICGAPIHVIGEQTAARARGTILEKFIQVDQMNTKDAQSLGKIMKNKYSGKRVLVLEGNMNRKELVEELGDNTQKIQLQVYETKLRKEAGQEVVQAIRECQSQRPYARIFVVFFSPSGGDAVLEGGQCRNVDWNCIQAVTLGNTTAGHLKDKYGIKSRSADSPSPQALHALISKILEENSE